MVWLVKFLGNQIEEKQFTIMLHEFQIFKKLGVKFYDLFL